MAKAKTMMPSSNEDWEAEQDLHHLTQAHKIRKDKKRHKRAKSMAAKKLKELAEMQAATSAVQGEQTGGAPAAGAMPAAGE
jgi:hypothetical protein